MPAEDMVAIFGMLGLSFLCIIALMSSLWLIYFFYRNAGLIDIGKALSLVVVGLISWVMGEGYWLRKTLLMAMLVVWACRLVYSYAATLRDREADARYRQFAQALMTGGTSGLFYLCFILQGLLIIVLTLPLMFVVQNPAPSLNSWEAVGIVIWFLAFWGGGVAEAQLRRFKRDPLNRRQPMQSGLWSLSRHPDDFFDWCIWIAFAVFAMGSPWGWLAWISVFLVLYLLLFVTGIPLWESVAERTQGDAYREYKRGTSAFIPWFPSKKE